MFGCKRDPNKKIESMASLLVLGGAIPLAAVIIAQYGFNLAPCHFCLLQRYPYVVLMLLGGLSLLLRRTSLRWKLCVALGIFALLVTGGLGIIHTLIENGVLNFKGGCVAQAAVDHSLAATRAAIFSAPIVSCAEVRAAFLGLSMATWNALWALLVITGIFLQYRFDMKHHASR
jgi:disulfide bond formation protein DsbB